MAQGKRDTAMRYASCGESEGEGASARCSRWDRLEQWAGARAGCVVGSLDERRRGRAKLRQPVRCNTMGCDAMRYETE